MNAYDVEDVKQCIQAMTNLEGFMTENAESGRYYVKIAFPDAKQMHDFVDGLRGLRAWVDDIEISAKVSA